MGTEPATPSGMSVRLFCACRVVASFLLGGACLLWLVAASLPAARAAGAASRPVTIQELCLLLRGGYTGAEVLRETSGRPLLEPLDDTAQRNLRTAGADQRFIDALKASHPALTDAEAEAARQQQSAIDARTAEGKAAYVSRMYEANKQAFEAHADARKQDALGQMAKRMRGQLVALRDDHLQPVGDDAVDSKKLFAFYFSAEHSRPCRQFTPTLVKFYQDFAPKHAAFDLVLVSLDRSAAEMESAMRQEAMPWPALAFDRRAAQPNLMKMGDGDLPRLVLIDGEGRLVVDSYADGKYVGPQRVLDALAKLAAAGGG